MTVIPINTKSRDYEVRIGAGLLDTLGDAVRSCTKARRCVLVAGENVSSLYGERAAESLRRAGLEVHAVTFPSGEETKCLRYYGELLEFMASHKLTRSDCAVALGGGVTGDLTGFAAATYQLGIDYNTMLKIFDMAIGDVSKITENTTVYARWLDYNDPHVATKENIAAKIAAVEPNEKSNPFNIK